MDLNRLGKQICQQAKVKGWGHTKETLIVSEKMILISTEVTELEESRRKKYTKAKDSVEAEYSDILLRTLHLGTAWGINFNADIKYKSKIKSTSTNFNSFDLLYLHNLVSKCYDYYRHKNNILFKKYLYLIAHETIKMSKTEGVDIEKGTVAKININKDRTWSQSRLNGNYKK